MRCVAYCRVSTEEGEQLNSLRNQVEYYQELFQENGYEPAPVGIFYRKNGTYEILNNGIFADQGISGTKIYKREAFQNMMRYAKDKLFDVVYCKNIQRFARSVADGATSLKELKKYGVNVYFQDQGLDYWTNESTVEILLSVAQSESAMKSKAVKFGHRKSQKSGKWTSAVPFGFNRVSGFLEINEDEARIVRDIYSWFLQGWGRTKIIRYLNNNGITGRNGYKWYQGHIRNILTNPVYYGKQIQHKTENKDVNIRIADNGIDEDNWIITFRPEIAIISEEDFNQVQAIMNKKAEEYKGSVEEGKKARRESNKHIFSNILVCGNCGGSMRAKTRRTTHKGTTIKIDGQLEYVCTNNDSLGKDACEYRNAIPECDLLEYVKKQITDLRNDNGAKLQRIFDMYIENYYRINTSEKIKELERKIKDLKTIQDNKIRLNSMDKNIVSDKELIESSKIYRQKLNSLEQEKLKLENIDREVVRARRNFSDFVKFINKVDINNLDNQTLKKIFNVMEIRTTDITNRNKFPFFQNIQGTEYKTKGKIFVKSISCTVNILDKNSSNIIIDNIIKNTPSNEEIKNNVRKLMAGNQ